VIKTQARNRNFTIPDDPEDPQFSGNEEPPPDGTPSTGPSQPGQPPSRHGSPPGDQTSNQDTQGTSDHSRTEQTNRQRDQPQQHGGNNHQTPQDTTEQSSGTQSGTQPSGTNQPNPSETESNNHENEQANENQEGTQPSYHEDTSYEDYLRNEKGWQAQDIYFDENGELLPSATIWPTNSPHYSRWNRDRSPINPNAVFPSDYEMQTNSGPFLESVMNPPPPSDIRQRVANYSRYSQEYLEGVGRGANLDRTSRIFQAIGWELRSLAYTIWLEELRIPEPGQPRQYY
jgi:hypothetical protein